MTHVHCLLLDLPDEILDAIIFAMTWVPKGRYDALLSWPYPEHHTTDLHALAVTCRKLYLLCLPYLWRDKEFILPEETTQPPLSSHHRLIATDVLGQPSALAMFPPSLGAHVRSLSRDLSTSPHYDLSNSALMAGLVTNLRALRMDFHPKPRIEQYGLAYFAQHCPLLSELYLENCRDTFDDFQSLVLHRSPLTSLALISCSVKLLTLASLFDQCRPTLTHLHLQGVCLEPSMTSPNNITTSYLASRAVVTIPHALYTRMLVHLPALTSLALYDSMFMELVCTLVAGAPNLERLTLSLHDQQPDRLWLSMDALTRLPRLTFLSLAFRYNTSTIPAEIALLPCALPSGCIDRWLRHLPPSLSFLHISAFRLLLQPDTVLSLVKPSSITRVLLHHVSLVPVPSLAPDETTAFEQERHMIMTTKAAWRSLPNWPAIEPFLLTGEQVLRLGLPLVNRLDELCITRGFDDWTSTM
ncbi:hypothetical protein DM01DRAFT_1160325 [Hesseltinella vesiculosa]|uniref:F-box domain-containing protein n=1 Tax=Hesseltinella vesiculosa TaxID=101127 RepID=A0A1X2GSI0_9FUNG|nr:hypothetical protein DM01DRAFT_1160325 [Hesseltinella vesiculosa]